MVYTGFSQINPNAIYRSLKNVRLGSLLKFGRNYIIVNNQFGKMIDGDMPQPTALHMEITTHCKKRCKGCYVPIEDRRTEVIMEQEIADKAVAMGKSWGIYMYNYMGGEPIREDTIPMIIRILDGNPNLSFYCCSNGEYLHENGRYFDDLIDRDNFTMTLSIDGLRETNDGIRGKGSFYKVMETAERLKSKRCFSGVVSTVRQSNWEELASDDFIDTLIDKNFTYMVYSIADVTDTETTNNLKKSLENQRNKPIFMYSSLGHINDGKKATKSRDIYIDINGEIYPGRKDRVSIGNLNSEMAEIVKNDRWLSRLC